MFGRASTRRLWAALSVLLLALTLIAIPAAPAPVAAAGQGTGVYRNPLPITIPGDGMQESCADPSIIHAQQPGDTAWYIYCTTDPLNGEDRNPSGGFNFHLIPMLRSYDLVNWTYMGDALPRSPRGWRPTPVCGRPTSTSSTASTICITPPPIRACRAAVAPSASRRATPLGPWTDAGAPVVEPHDAPCCPGSRRWVFDPAVMTVGGQKYIFYGSYFGGISARTLSADGLHSDPASQTQITIDNRYEGAFPFHHGGYWYLFASATDCCRGPLTGYSVFAGRSANRSGRMWIAAAPRCWPARSAARR